MAQPTIDQILKEMTELYPKPFVRAVFPRAKFRVISTKLDKELTIKTRLSDRVILLETAAGKRVLHFEFQLRYRRKIPERLFVYNGALTAKYQTKVASFLFLIKPSRKLGEVGVYGSDLFGQTTNEFTFRVIHLQELRKAILSGDKNYRIFAPLLLEIAPKPNTADLRQVRDIINLETEARRRDELFGFAIPIARRHFGLKVIQSIFTEAYMAKIKWEDLPYIGDTIKIKKQEGWQEGRVLALQEMLVDLLTDQFGRIPNKTLRAVQAIQTPQRLKAIVRKCVKAESLAEAQKLLAASKAKTNGRNGATMKKKSQI
jgi:hypothetical protein